MSSQNEGRNDSAGGMADPVPLRRRAEEKARAAGDEDLDALSPEEARRLLHELRVRQVELEMQNEELRRAQEELEASRARYFDLYDLAPVGYLTLSELGLILEANLTAAALLGVARGALVNEPLSRFIVAEDQDVFYRHRKRLLETGEPQVCEVRMVPRAQGSSPFWAQLEAGVAQRDRLGEATVAYRVVLSDITQRKRDDADLQRLARDRGERVKELECLYRLSALIEQPGLSIDDILQGAVRLLPFAWRFPEVTCARILYEDREFRTGNCRETEWRQAADLVVRGRPAGRIEVYCLEPRSKGDDAPFLAEEQILLDAVAERLNRTIERVAAEEELRIQRQRLELIIDNVPAFLVYTDADWNILHANRGYAAFWGRTREQIIGRNVKEVASPVAYQQLAGYVRQAMASRQAVSWEDDVTSAAGQTYYMRRTYVPHLDEQGDVDGFVALVQDVTAQMRAEEALRASEERYRLLVENMHEGVAVVNEDAVLTYVNDALCAMIGQARDELVGQQSIVFFPRGEQAQHQEWLARRRAGFSDTYEAVLNRKGGGQVPTIISASPILDSQGEFRGSLAVLTDITKRVEAEEALRRRFEELTVLNRIAHAVTVTTELPTGLAQVGEIIAGLFAAYCVHILWWEGEEAGFHLHVGRLLDPGQASPTRLDASRDELTFIGRVLHEARPQVIADVRSLPLSDMERDVLVHGQVQSLMLIPLVIRGTAIGLLWVTSDQPGRLFTASEMHLAETMALDLAAAIESARLSRQAQAAAVAEERNRLARDLHDAATQTIYAATLIAEALPDVWARNPAEGQRNLVKLRQLVRGALAEMRTLLFELRPWTLEAAELSRLLEYLGNALTGRTRVPVEFDIHGEGELPADTKVALYRIAQEAFNNTAKHSGAARVRVTLRRETEQGVLSIEDDGRGFDPSSVGGDRMGLNIMRERAEAIGAVLTVESAPGRGAKVTVAWQKEDR